MEGYFFSFSSKTKHITDNKQILIFKIMVENIQKIDQKVEIASRSGREVTYGLKIADAEGAGEAGNFYTLNEGETFRVPKAEDAELASQTFGQGKVWLLKGIKTDTSGVEEVTYFNLNILHRRDVDNKPVFPEFGNMQDISTRAKAICDAGGIKAVGEIKYKRPVFDRIKNQMATQVDESGKAVRVFTDASCANIVLL